MIVSKLVSTACSNQHRRFQFYQPFIAIAVNRSRASLKPSEPEIFPLSPFCRRVKGRPAFWMRFSPVQTLAWRCNRSRKTNRQFQNCCPISQRSVAPCAVCYFYSYDPLDDRIVNRILGLVPPISASFQCSTHFIREAAATNHLHEEDLAWVLTRPF